MAITPNSIAMDGDEGGILLTSDSSGIWSSNVGELYTDAGMTALYDGTTSRTTIYFKPFNLTTDGVVQCGLASASVSVKGVVPDFPHYPMEWNADKRGIIPSLSRTGRTRGRIIGEGEIMRDYKLIYDRKKPNEVEDFEIFHHHHYPNRDFIYRNRWSGIDGLFSFDSALKASASSRKSGKLEVALKQVPYDAAAELAAERLMDQVTSVGVWAAFGLTRLYRNYRGPAIRVKNAMDFEQDIGFDPSGNLATNQLAGDAPYAIVKWYDQSGNANDLISDDGTEPALDVSAMAVDFNDDVLYFPSTAALTAGEIFIKVKMDANPPIAGLGSLWTLGSAGLSTHYYYHGDGNIYQGFLSTDRQTISHGSINVAVWHVYSAYSRPGERASYYNGNLIGSVGTSNVVSHATVPRLGQGTVIGSHYLAGQVKSLVITRDKVLDSERANLAANL